MFDPNSYSERTFINMKVSTKFKFAIAASMVQAASSANAQDIKVPTPPIHSPVIQKAIGLQQNTGVSADIVGNKMWFFSGVVPFGTSPSRFLAMSLSPGAVRVQEDRAREKKNKNDVKTDIWLDIWEGGQGKVASVRTDNYQYTRDIPKTITTAEDVYMFFIKDHATFQEDAPVLRRTPGGWAWQAAGTVEEHIRRQVHFADFSAGKIFNGLGTIVADFGNAKPWPAGAIDLGCQVRENHVVGMAGILSPIGENLDAREGVTQHEPRLPYSELIYYTSKGDRKVVTVPNFVSGGVTEDNSLIKGIREKAEINGDSKIYYGLPAMVLKHGTPMMYFWTEVSKRGTPSVFMLTQFDGHTTRVIYAYLLQRNILWNWNGSKWTRGDQVGWIFDQILGVQVHPIVGTDVDGNIVAYAPPQFMRLK